MIAIEQTGEELVVSQGPSVPYRAITAVWPVAVIIAYLSLGSRLPAHGLLLVGAGAASVLVMAALLAGWRRRAVRFDRRAGVMILIHGGLVRIGRKRAVPFKDVAAVVDHQAAGERAIELVLVDRAAVVVARARSGSSALEDVARRVSELLEKPVELGRGVLIAGRFEIDRLTNRGGMGLVYRALDRVTGQPVALKLSWTAHPADAHTARFAREIELLAGLDHPRIARYVSHGTLPGGQAFLAMQWLEGKDLSAALLAGPLPLDDTMSVLRGAAEAVAAVHANAVIHRDLKPSNLFLRGGSTRDLLLLDFGIARRLGSATRLTGSAALVGTPHYMAPEQASSARELSPAVDVFALGCIFYECLTARHPFDAPVLAGVLARILFDVPDPVAALRPGVPEAWLALLARMLDKKPDARPADAAALLHELDALPAADSADAALRATVPAFEHEPDDQVWVSVILATLPRGGISLDGQSGKLEALQSAMRRFGCPLERLVDGSLLATVSPLHSAIDQVRVAARCALLLREQLPQARIAVSTGRAALRKRPGVGTAVDKAAQLLAALGTAPQGAIRLDSVSAGLLEDRFLIAAGDGAATLCSEKLDPEGTRLLLGKPTPCVGRDVELLQLEGLAASSIEEALPCAAVVLGPAGIGKSRLRREFLGRLRTRYPACLELIGYGDPLSAGSPYVLLSDALRRRAGIRVGDEPEAARAALTAALGAQLTPAQLGRVAEFLGELTGVLFPDEHSPPLFAARRDPRVMSEQIALAFTDWLAAECAAQPVILALEDVQWGDALSLKLVERALRDLKRGALCVLALGRPETSEALPDLLGPQRALTLALRPLGDRASAALIRDVLGSELAQESLERIVQLAAGNALFLEELIRAAVQGKAGDVPETVVAMIQARLSRLPPDARLALRAASVLGETFWEGGVNHIAAAWGLSALGEGWVAQLAREELIEPLRTSRFLDEQEYGFRHALVCEAALGLLGDADRRSGHLAAAAWLESAGEADAIVLARHAEEGGDPVRASALYVRAAEQSLDRHDFARALARTERGIALGATGAELGRLYAVQAAAHYNQGRWVEAARTGLAALELVARGGALWCFTVETLMQVLPNVGDFERTEQLSDELLEIEPAPGARTSFARAVSSRLLGYAISGNRARGQACLDFIDKLGPELTQHDIVARGSLRLWRSLFTFVLGDDPLAPLSLAAQAIQDLSEGQVMYRVSLAYTVRAFAFWGLGELEQSEALARHAREIALGLHDDYQASMAAWYLGLTLSEHADEDKLDEAERCALSVLALQGNAIFEATARSMFARVALARRDWPRAEAEARAARTGLVAIVPYRFLATVCLIAALRELGRDQEAADVGREDLALLEQIGGPVYTEVALLVSVADALFATGDGPGGERALGAALQQIERRARKLSDPTLKASYLERRAENRRAVELARTRLGAAR